jgi:hypothetical protein
METKFVLAHEDQALKMDKGDESKGPYWESRSGHASCSHSTD